MSNNLKNETWYVDRNGKIDKMSSDEVLDGLMTKNIKVVHRVSRDRKSWRAICNEPFFENLIEKASEYFNQESRKYGEKSKIDSSQKDQTGFHNLGDISSKIDEQLDHAQQLQEIGVKLNTLRSLSSEIIGKKKHVVNLSNIERTANENELHPDDQNEYVGIPTYSDKLKKFFTLNDGKRGVRIISVLLIAFFAILFALKSQEYQARKERDKIQAEIQAANEARALGQYEQAVKIYSGIKNINSMSTNELLEMADSYIRNSQLSQGQSTLSEVVKRNPSAKQRSQIENMLGIVAMQTQKNDLAFQYFTNSIAHEEIFSSLYNLAVLQIKKNDFLSAEALLLRALALEPDQRGIVLILMFEVAWQLENKKVSSDKNRPAAKNRNETPLYPRLSKIALLVKKENSQPNSWSPELYAIETMIYALNHNTEDLIASANKWMEMDETTIPERKNLYNLNYDLTTWSRIYSLCTEVYKRPDTSSLKGLFFAPCVAKQKGPLSAIAYAQYALKQRPELSNLRGYLAHLIFASGNPQGARQILKEGDITDSNIGKKTISHICKSEPNPKKCQATFGFADAL